VLASLPKNRSLETGRVGVDPGRPIRSVFADGNSARAGNQDVAYATVA